MLRKRAASCGARYFSGDKAVENAMAGLAVMFAPLQHAVFREIYANARFGSTWTTGRAAEDLEGADLTEM
jgi:hypothetical protein